MNDDHSHGELAAGGSEAGQAGRRGEEGKADLRYFSQPVEAMRVPGDNHILGVSALHEATTAFQSWMDEQTHKHCLGFEYDEEGDLFVFQSPLVQEDPVEVAPGDWVVIGDDGIARSMTDEAFEATYVADQDRTKFHEVVGTIAAGIREMRIASMADQLGLSRIEGLIDRFIDGDREKLIGTLNQALEIARVGLPAKDMADIEYVVAGMDEEARAS